MRARTVVTITMLIGSLVLPATPARAKGKVLRVDVSGSACPGAGYTRIQDAIDAASPGTTIQVCAGTYPEQLVITKRVKIVGTGGAVLRPAGLRSRTSSLRTGRLIAAGVEVAAAASLDGFDIDLSQNGLGGCSDSDPLLAGIYFRGTSGAIKNSVIHNVRHPAPASTCDSGAAVLVQADGTHAIRVTVSGNTIHDYQRAGIVVNERGARGMISNNIVNGLGSTANLAQNGIQVGFGATATVTGNVVQDNAGPSGSLCDFDGGNLSFQADRGLIQGNTFRGNTAGVLINGGRNRVLRNTVEGRSGGVAMGLDGIAVTGDRNVLVGNTVREVSAVGIRLNGSRNVTKRNVVSDTHEAALCAAARALPGCANVLDVCGVGLWIGGSGNVNARNQLSGNDVDLHDEGSRTLGR